jgi:hypothetical protein
VTIAGDGYHLAINVRGYRCSKLSLRLVNAVALTGEGEGEWEVREFVLL